MLGAAPSLQVFAPIRPCILAGAFSDPSLCVACCDGSVRTRLHVQPRFPSAPNLRGVALPSDPCCMQARSRVELSGALGSRSAQDVARAPLRRRSRASLVSRLGAASLPRWSGAARAASGVARSASSSVTTPLGDAARAHRGARAGPVHRTRTSPFAPASFRRTADGGSECGASARRGAEWRAATSRLMSGENHRTL